MNMIQAKRRARTLAEIKPGKGPPKKTIDAAMPRNPVPVTASRSPSATTYDGGEDVQVPIPKVARVALRIQVADVFEYRKVEKTRWMAAIDLDIDCGPGSYRGSIMADMKRCPGTKGFPTRTAALVNACKDAIEHLDLRAKQFRKAPMVCTCLRTAIQSIEYFRASLAPFVPANGEKSAAVQVVEPAAGPLTHDESKRLNMCETVIARNLHSFVEVGSALATIQMGRLYRDTHKTFEEYCQEKFEIGRQHAYRLIEATNVVKDLSPNGDSRTLPATESQARALAKVKNPDIRLSVWNEVVAAAPKSPAGGTPLITARLIEEKVSAVLGKPKAKAKGEGGRGKAEGKKAAAKTISFLDEDLAYIRRTVQTVADAWTTKYQRQQICDLLRRMVKELAVK